MQILDITQPTIRRKLQKRGSLHKGSLLLQPGTTHPRVFGYARVSRDNQNLDMQLSAIKEAGSERIFEEKISAVSAHRPQFNVMLKLLEPGDTLIVYAFNRLCRDLKQLLTVVDGMKAIGVKLHSTSEPHIDPYSTNGRLLISVTGAVDENERNRICDRTRDGMRVRKAAGMFFGRTRIVTDAVANKMQKMRDEGKKVTFIATKFGIKPSTVYANTKR